VRGKPLEEGGEGIFRNTKEDPRKRYDEPNIGQGWRML
jgi:hypothetical protein